MERMMTWRTGGATEALGLGVLLNNRSRSRSRSRLSRLGRLGRLLGLGLQPFFAKELRGGLGGTRARGDHRGARKS